MKFDLAKGSAVLRRNRVNYALHVM